MAVSRVKVAFGVAIERIETKCSVVDAAGEADEGPVPPAVFSFPRSFVPDPVAPVGPVAPVAPAKPVAPVGPMGPVGPGGTVSSIRAGCTSRASCAGVPWVQSARLGRLGLPTRCQSRVGRSHQ